MHDDHTHELEHTHAHVYDHTHEHEQEHETMHEHLHSHHHSPEEKKRQINRINRISGHLNHVKGMIEDDVDCADVLVQLAAVRSALNGLGKEIINEHITHCIYHAVEDGDTRAVEEFQKAIQKFL
ncbi:MAG: metal-sensing transcriptional repressor [Lachnospiraceae bacterium]|nr:metal-sensing transcriptional repressor [Lachnospiraceae bacterium]